MSRTTERLSTLRVERSLADFRTRLVTLTPHSWGTVAQCAIEWLREIRSSNPKLAFELVKQQAKNAAERLSEPELSCIDDEYSALIAATPPAIEQLLTVNAALALASVDPRDRAFFRPFELVLNFDRVANGDEVRASRSDDFNCCHKHCPYIVTHVRRDSVQGIHPRVCSFHVSSIGEFYDSIEPLPTPESAVQG